MKKLIITMTLMATFATFGAILEEQYAFAKTNNLPNTMRQIAVEANNTEWRAEAFALANSIMVNVDPATASETLVEQETSMLDWMYASSTFNKEAAKAWIVEDKLGYVNPDFLLRYNDSANNLVKAYIAATKNQAYKITAAINVNNKDILIDTGLALNFRVVSASFATRYFVALSKLDANYRSTEVLGILKNMNKIYTLKMYEDGQEAIWKPLVTKIRAMIEIY